MSTLNEHNNFILGGTGASFDYDPFVPLDAAEYRRLTSVQVLCDLDDELLEQRWLVLGQRMLQVRYRIDQRRYNSSTRPTLAELTSDFTLAAVMIIDRMAMNPAGLQGVESIEGSSHFWDREVPAGVSALMGRYKRSGGGVRRV